MKNRSTQLLVSVRNAQEAKSAMLAGVDIIDAKNPDAGSLGRCVPETWQSIQNIVNRRVPLSAALGEWHEWKSIDDQQLARAMAALSGYQYAKIGPSNSIGANCGKWQDTFENLRNAAPGHLQWIAVVYADSDTAQSLDRYDILKHATQLRLHGILIDTWSKNCNWQWNRSWSNYCRQVTDQNLKLALAGSLSRRKIGQIGAGQADWFAVRGAACIEGQRNARISYRNTNRLVKFVNQLNCNRPS